MNYVFGAGFALLLGAIGVIAVRRWKVSDPRPNVFRQRAAQLQGLDLEEQ